MEERKNIVDYMEQVFKIFGFSIVILSVFSLLIGEETRDYSSIFSMGKEGLGIAVMGQFLSMAVWIVFMRFLFFTDVLIKNMWVVFRACGMVASILVMVVVYVSAFGWFPADDWFCWALFLACFGICFGISLAVTAFKERAENKKMEEALDRLKRQNQ